MKGGFDSIEYFNGLLPKNSAGETIYTKMTDEEYETLLEQPQNQDIAKKRELFISVLPRKEVLKMEALMEGFECDRCSYELGTPGCIYNTCYSGFHYGKGKEE